MSTATVIRDLSTVQPATALSSGREPGHWRVSSYACEGVEGKLLYTDSDSEVPAVALPLGLRGWHRVTIGLWGELESRRYGADGNRFKLAGDPCFRPLVRQTPAIGTLVFETIEEVVLTCADLTGKDLIIAPPPPGSNAVTAVVYVRCEPLAPEEVRKIETDRNRKDCRRIIAYNDGLSFFGRREQWDKEDFWEMIEPYRDSDVESLYWGLVGDVTVFPVEHGTMATGPGAEKWESLMARGIHPVVTAMEYAHQLGLQFYIYQRMGAWADPFPMDIWVSDFTKAHPEFRCVSKEGVPIGRLSYAYAEVRRRQVDLLSEVVGYGADGVDLNFMRGPVYVFYEEPLLSGFKKEFGDDPRRLDEWDERWLQYRQWPLTAFLRELRRELDSLGKKLGKRLAISAVTFPTPLGNLYYGLDVETWVQEGLIDRLVPWGLVRGMPAADLDYYSELIRGTSTTFWPFLPIHEDPSGPDYNSYRQDALEYYAAGAQGLAMWDLLAFHSMSVKGPLLRRMGHLDELRDAVQEQEKDEEPVTKKFEQIGAIDFTVRSAPATHRERLMPGEYPKHMFMWPS